MCGTFSEGDTKFPYSMYLVAPKDLGNTVPFILALFIENIIHSSTYYSLKEPTLLIMVLFT